MTMLKLTKNSLDFFDVDEKFSDYLDFIEYLFCPRHWYKDKGSEWHHSGGFAFLLSKGKKISREEFELWKNDLEHGFFHGFIVGFWIFCQFDFDAKKLIGKNKIFHAGQNKSNELHLNCTRYIYSALFHDFLKCLGQKENHDNNLTDWFPDCLPETYVHENPDESMKNNILISSDRIELNRYSDISSWIDYDKMGFYFKSNVIFINKFYSNYRKGIERFFSGRDCLWLSHVSEEWFRDSIFYLKFFPDMYHHKFYPEFHWVCPFGFGTTYDKKMLYSVYSDYLPMDGCHRHIIIDLRENQPFTCGLIEKSRLEKNGSLFLVSDKDHPVVFREKDVLQSEWIFVYRNKNIDLKNIDAQNNTVVSINNLNNFFKVMRLIFGKIEAHKVY